MKRNRNINKISFIFFGFIFVGLFVNGGALADVTYTFSWDANHPNDNVEAYRIYWSIQSENYNDTDRIEILVSDLIDPDNPEKEITLDDPPAGDALSWPRCLHALELEARGRGASDRRHVGEPHHSPSAARRQPTWTSCQSTTWAWRRVLSVCLRPLGPDPAFMSPGAR